LNKENNNVLFREVQRFRQIWIWILVLLAPGICLWAFVQQIILGEPFGNNPASDIVLIILCIVVGLGLPLLFLVLKLTTEVQSDGIYYKFTPFHRSFRRIESESIAHHEVRTYRPIGEYGGWGIRYGPSGTAYNVSGNQGLQLYLSSGKNVLIGTQRPNELSEAVERALKNKKKRHI